MTDEENGFQMVVVMVFSQEVHVVGGERGGGIIRPSALLMNLSPERQGHPAHLETSRGDASSLHHGRLSH